MIQASDDLRALIGSGQLARADLYTIRPVGLDPMTWTSADQDIQTGGVTYAHVGARIERGRSKLVIGLEVDSLDLTLTVDPANEPLINGVPLRQAAQRGILDGAEIRLDWAYLPDWSAPLRVVGVIPRFCGVAGNIEVGRMSVKIPVNSPLKKLDVQVPAQTYGPACRWSMGDSGCGAAPMGYSQVLGDGADNRTLPLSLPDGVWADGWLQLLSGANQGVRRSIRSYAGGVLTLSTPLPFAPLAGDRVTVYPGCDRVWPQTSAQSMQAVVPSGLTVSAADYAGDAGVSVGATSYKLVWYDVYGVEHPLEPGAVSGWVDGRDAYLVNDPNGDGRMFVFPVQKAVSSSQPLAAVAGTPGPGQYSVSSSGLYRFHAAQAGATVWIGYRRWVGGGKSCSTYGNVARFGGMPFVPTPETAA